MQLNIIKKQRVALSVIPAYGFTLYLFQEGNYGTNRKSIIRA